MRYKVTEEGFKKIQYYVSENLFETFDPMDEYSCIDSWIYHLLALTHNEETPTRTYEEFCKEIFIKTIGTKDFTSEFLEAIKIIQKNDFIG